MLILIEYILSQICPKYFWGRNKTYWGRLPQIGSDNNSHDLRFFRLPKEYYQHNLPFCEVDLVNIQREIANHQMEATG